MKRYQIEQIIVSHYDERLEERRIVYSSDDMQQVLDAWREVFSGANDEAAPFDRQNFSKAIFYRIVDTL